MRQVTQPKVTIMQTNQNEDFSIEFSTARKHAIITKSKLLSGEIQKEKVVELAKRYVHLGVYSVWLDVFYQHTEVLRQLTLLWLETNKEHRENNRYKNFK